MVNEKVEQTAEKKTKATAVKASSKKDTTKKTAAKKTTTAAKKTTTKKKAATTKKAAAPKLVIVESPAKAKTIQKYLGIDGTHPRPAKIQIGCRHRKWI